MLHCSKVACYLTVTSALPQRYLTTGGGGGGGGCGEEAQVFRIRSLEKISGEVIGLGHDTSIKKMGSDRT